jgi:hypothetical protein
MFIFALRKTKQKGSEILLGSEMGTYEAKRKLMKRNKEKNNGNFNSFLLDAKKGECKLNN